MRLLLDAKFLVSYLLHSGADSPVTLIIESCVLGKATLLLPEALLEELTASVANKPYLNARIQPEEFARLATILHRIGQTVPRIESPIPAVTRDPKDDYLLAYAVVGEADYLITGDNDLLVLQQVVGVTICTPRDFVDQWPRDEEHRQSSIVNRKSQIVNSLTLARPPASRSTPAAAAASECRVDR